MTIIKNHAVALSVSIVLLLAFGGWEIFKYELVPRRWGVVEQGAVYRSGRIAPHLVRKTLQKFNIRVVVDLTEPDPTDAAWRAEQAAVKEQGLSYYNFALTGDGTGNITNYAKALAAMQQARKEKKPVLVHCAAGAQRTGGIIAAYRVLVEKQSPATAYAELLRYNWKPKKDKVLLEYLRAHMAELLSLLQDWQVIRRERRSIPQITP